MDDLKYCYSKLIKIKPSKLSLMTDSEVIDEYILYGQEDIPGITISIGDAEYSGTIVGIYNACDIEIRRMILEDGSSVYFARDDYSNEVATESCVAQLIKKQTDSMRQKRNKKERIIIYTLILVLIAIAIFAIVKIRDAKDDPIINISNGISHKYVSVEDLYEDVKDSVVLIHIYDSNGKSYGTASGMIITSDGYLISCSHIYSGVTTPFFKVITGSGDRYETVFVAGDVESDICLLKIVNPNNIKFHPVKFADSDLVDFGENGVILGFPGGVTIQPVVTEGLISATDVRIKTATGYENSCIQTSATANPGNSGGGLFDMRGRVVGLVTSKYSATNYENTTYCVPSKTIEKIVNRLFFIGYISRPTFGIQFRMTNELDIDNGLPYGGIVVGVSEGSALTGLVSIDEIITHINGNAISLTYDFYDAMQNIGEDNPEVTITVYNKTYRSSRDIKFVVNFRTSASGYIEE